MRVVVSRMRVRGVPRQRNEVSGDAGLRGELHVEEARDELLGRVLRVARLAPTMPMDPVPLPALSDVVLLWMGPQGFVLGGFETVNGIAYAQSWWCRTAGEMHADMDNDSSR
jgi:hypothetical protein